MAETSGENNKLCRVMVNPWVTGLLAVAELVLGFLLLSFPFVLGASAVWVCGFVLFAAGLVRVVQCLIHAENRWWNLLAALVYLSLGWMMLRLPVLSLEVGTLGIGIALTVAGVLRLLMAAVLHSRAGSLWRVFNGLISLALGLLVIWGWPGSSFWVLGSIIAVEMIFSGWTLLFLALAPSSTKTV